MDSSTSTPLANMAGLGRLESSLKRGGNHPLTLRAVVKHIKEGPIMEALVKHAPRWRDVYLCCDLESFPFMGVAGDLPHLERLSICNHSLSGANTTFFESASLLKDVMFNGSISSIPSLPWAQLQAFRYRDDDGSTDLGAALSLLERLSADVDFSLSLEITGAELRDLLPIVSHASSFGLELMASADGNLDPVNQALRKTLQALTLPHLKELTFDRDWYKAAPRWDHVEFLPFASRSSLQTTLTTLDIHILISDEELLQCLSALPLLKILGISDGSGRQANILITDNLFRRLTWRADNSYLVPHLHLLFISSLFTFSDNAFCDFLVSRLIPCRTHVPRSEPFQVLVCWLAKREREFSPEVSARITGLMAGRIGL
ncbi:hypothetical protein B0H12DRAFT_105979 [Mycena haematopus]|nr:hypothetical protein B0H12DRAFT_105979 [Mycena haematopus]